MMFLPWLGVGVSLIGAPTAPTAIPHSVPQLAALYGCKACRKGANEHGSGEPERELGSGPARGVERLPCGHDDLVHPLLRVRLAEPGSRGDELRQIASVLWVFPKPSLGFSSGKAQDRSNLSHFCCCVPRRGASIRNYCLDATIHCHGARGGGPKFRTGDWSQT